MKFIIIMIVLGIMGMFTEEEQVPQEQVKTEQVQEVKEEVKEELTEEQKQQQKEERKQAQEKALKEREEKAKAEYTELFKNSPYPMIDFKLTGSRNYVTLQANMTRNEWVQGFYSKYDSRGDYCGYLGSRRGGYSEKTIREWHNKCQQKVATGVYDNLDWYFYHENEQEKQEFNEVFEPLASLYTLTGDKKELYITVVDTNGEVIYKVNNEDKQTIFKSFKEWANDEQLWILSHVKEFRYDYYDTTSWLENYNRWLGLEK